MRSLLFVVAALLAGAAHAGIDLSDYNKNNPDYKAVSAKPSALPGVFEVTFADGGVGYMDAAAKFLLVGALFDLKTKQMLTPTAKQNAVAPGQAAQRAPAAPININSLPLAGAIKIVRGNGKRKLVLFSDPDCPFCRELESTLDRVSDSTVYVFPYPIAELHPRAADKAASAYCHSDPVTGWRIAVLGGGALPKASDACKKKVSATVALGEHLGLTMTPTIFNSAGVRRSGSMSAQELVTWIQ